MLKRADIFDSEMLNTLRVVGDFDCRRWNCNDCPFNIDVGSGCVSMEVKNLVDRYDHGEEVIY